MCDVQIHAFVESLQLFFFFFKQKTAYEMRISDWSSDVCSSDLLPGKSRYVMDARPAPRAGVTLFCARGELPSSWVRVVLAEKDVDGARIEQLTPGKPHQDLMVLNPSGELPTLVDRDQTGRASCRESVCQYV